VEAKKAGSLLIDKLDTDEGGTLNFKELQGRLAARNSKQPIPTTMEI
jgi:hypothetical protein